jgi:hypothetical protein
MLEPGLVQANGGREPDRSPFPDAGEERVARLRLPEA